MTEDELDILYVSMVSSGRPAPVVVNGGDYGYDGWVVAVFSKRGRALRAVVEDEYGRLAFHNAGQITERKE